MRPGSRGSGIHVDPLRVREARREAGLSLAQVAGDEISRTFVYLVEHGRSRPSKAVLTLIAKRTGRPISYFVVPPSEPPQPTTDLATDLLAVASRIRSEIANNRLDRLDHEVLKLLEISIRQGAEVARAVQERSGRRPKSSRIRALPKAAEKAS